MPQGIVFTFLELGDATSVNLEFSHLRTVHVSYGEETITESNLLEIRRRHPRLVRIHTFTRREEAHVGADWEWHIVGQRYTLSMRIQAKRVQCDGKLKIRHLIRSTGLFQRDRLLSVAGTHNMMPIYCIYCTGPQRSKWKQSRNTGHCREYQTGCLLADAANVTDTTRRLSDIEHICIPWHYLFLRANLVECKFERVLIDHDDLSLREVHRYLQVDNLIGNNQDDQPVWNHPTIDDLNGLTDSRYFDRTGVHETDGLDRDMLVPDVGDGDYGTGTLYERIRERGVRRVLVIDVRNEVVPDER